MTWILQKDSTSGGPCPSLLPIPNAVVGSASSGLPISTLFANDSDADGDVISLVSVSANSAHGGTVTVSGKWVFYAPAPGWTSADTFTYIIADTRGGAATGTVTVNIKVDRHR